MHVILTHEQADFDAVAAMLAARLLEADSHAVLPRRTNRNVHAFLALYGDELPFEAMDDLPRQRVDRVTLVDTQSMPSIRGVGGSTRIHVVDHHPRNKPLPPGWTVAVEGVGAHDAHPVGHPVGQTRDGELVGEVLQGVARRLWK